MLGDVLVLGLLGDLVVGFAGVVFNGGLVAELLLLRGFAVFDETLRTLAFLADVLVATRDGQRVVVGPFDVDVLLLDTGKFAVKLVTLFRSFTSNLGVKDLMLLNSRSILRKACLSYSSKRRKIGANS